MLKYVYVRKPLYKFVLNKTSKHVEYMNGFQGVLKQDDTSDMSYPVIDWFIC